LKRKFNNSIEARYPTLNELRNRNFLNIATALGIGVTAVTVPFSVQAKDETITESTTDKETESERQKEKIILLVANLGHDDFKERDKATQFLITIGKKNKNDNNSELIAFLDSELEKCKESRDPEVKERAKKILLAITPPPPKTPNHAVRGRIRVKGK